MKQTIPPNIKELLYAVKNAHLIFSNIIEMTSEEIELMQNIADSNSHHPVDCLGIGIQMGMIIMQQRLLPVTHEFDNKSENKDK